MSEKISSRETFIVFIKIINILKLDNFALTILLNKYDTNIINNIKTEKWIA